MKSSLKKMPGSIVEFDIELTHEEFKAYYEQALERALGEVHLKGFRPGQAPKEMAKQYIDQEKVFNVAANSAVRQSLHEVLDDEKITPIDTPKITIDNDDKKFKYRATIVTFPEIKLGNYKKIASAANKERAAVTAKIVVADEEVSSALDWVKKSGAELKNFKDDSELKKSIGEGLRMEKEEREKQRYRVKILDEVTKDSTIDIPAIMIDKTVEQYKIKPEEARKNVAEHLVIHKIAEIEQLNPTPEEVGNIDPPKRYDYTYGVLQSNKVFEFLEQL